jgi:hypothetical protein
VLQSGAGKMDAQLAAVIVADEPVENQAAAQQHAGGAAQPCKVARDGPNRHVRRHTHHRGGEHRHGHAESIESILEHQIADQRCNQGSAQVPGIVDCRQPPRLGNTESCLLLHQRQQRRICEPGHAKRQNKARDAGAEYLVAI